MSLEGSKNANAIISMIMLLQIVDARRFCGFVNIKEMEQWNSGSNYMT